MLVNQINILGCTISMNNNGVMMCGFAFDVERVWASDFWRALAIESEKRLIGHCESVGSFTHVGC